MNHEWVPLPTILNRLIPRYNCRDMSTKLWLTSVFVWQLARIKRAVWETLWPAIHNLSAKDLEQLRWIRVNYSGHSFYCTTCKSLNTKRELIWDNESQFEELQHQSLRVWTPKSVFRAFPVIKWPGNLGKTTQSTTKLFQCTPSLQNRVQKQEYFHKGRITVPLALHNSMCFNTLILSHDRRLGDPMR